MNATHTATRFKIVAVNDDTDTCSCCGRTNLKRVAWVATIVDGVEFEPAPFGTTCAAKAVANSRGGDEFKEAGNIHATKVAIKNAAKTGNTQSVLCW
jgi:hypothetical protein